MFNVGIDIISINDCLELIINLAIVVAMLVLALAYYRVRALEREIEQHHVIFEASRARLRNQAIPVDIINGQIKKEERILQEYIAPLERRRQKILSKVPFLR